MATIRKFEDIEAWQEARKLNRLLFAATNTRGFRENFDIRGQLRGSSNSIMSNIAEGFERDGDREFRQFLSIAKGSVGELRSQLYGAMDSGLIPQETFDDLCGRATSVSRMIAGLMKYLSTSTIRGTKYKTRSIQ